MKIKNLFGLLMLFLLLFTFISCKTYKEAHSIAIIGSANGPTSIYVTNNDGQALTHRENGWYHVLSADSLSAKPIITVKDMVGLKLEKDYYGKYAISGRISKHKINKWADETENAIGKQIAFVYNDSIISDPQVNGRIESGTFMITSLSDKKLPDIYKGILKEKSDTIEVIFADWEKDSLYYELSPEERDSVNMGIDYWEAKAWLDMSSKPDEHYWYNIEDSSEYVRLEKALEDELEKTSFSSKASDYMKSEAYKAYKQYLHENKDYINLMFQGFLFNNLKGLHGYLVDDIIQSKYPSAPSIRSYIDKTDNVDDERFAVYEWQRKVWFLMNTTQENNTVMSDDRKARKRIDKMMEKANRYRESITDTTYLQTTVEMSYSAIDALNADGYNDDYLYNQVVYMAALDRARKYLSEKDGKLVCTLSSHEDINVRKDLYDFILDVFRQWNEMLDTGNFKIIKDEKGVLMVVHKDYGNK